MSTKSATAGGEPTAARASMNRSDSKHTSNRAEVNSGGPILLGATIDGVLQKHTAIAPPEYEELSTESMIVRKGERADPCEAFTGQRFGLISDLWDAIASKMLYPSKSFAFGAACAIFSAICGRAYNCHELGLATYWVFVGPTGFGKNAVLKAASELSESVRPHIGKADLRSAPALKEQLVETPSYCWLIDEIAQTWKIEWYNPKAAGTNQQTGVLVTELFTANNPTGELQRSRYKSDRKEVREIPSVHFPALSIFGVTQPEIFAEAISRTNVTSGAIPRFMVLRAGATPEPNEGFEFKTIPEPVRRGLAELAEHVGPISLTNHEQSQPITVAIDASASRIFDDFKHEVHEFYIAHESDNMARGIYQRGREFVYKIAGLLAVSENHREPRITARIARAACSFVREERTQLVEDLSDDLPSGNIQADALDKLREVIADHACKLRREDRRFPRALWDDVERAKALANNKDALFVSRRDIYQRVHRLKVFAGRDVFEDAWKRLVGFREITSVWGTIYCVRLIRRAAK